MASGSTAGLAEADFASAFDPTACAERQASRERGRHQV